jgi:hypothetical protein
VSTDIKAMIFSETGDTKMKSIKGFTMGLMLGLALALSSIAFAQNATQNDPNKKTESCCAMASCCCKGDSCPMKDGKDSSCCKGDKSAAKKDDCCGDSCNMKMKNMKGMKDKSK